MNAPLTAAVVQLSSQDDVSANLARVQALALEARDRGAELVTLPENFAFFGDEDKKREIAEDVDPAKGGGSGQIMGTLRSTAIALGVWIIGGTLPGGRYVSVINIGPYNELMEANMALDSWARANGHKLDGTVSGDEFRNATRLEIYHKDPGEDPSGHPVTEVAFRLAD